MACRSCKPALELALSRGQAPSQDFRHLLRQQHTLNYTQNTQKSRKFREGMRPYSNQQNYGSFSSFASPPSHSSFPTSSSSTSSSSTSSSSSSSSSSSPSTSAATVHDPSPAEIKYLRNRISGGGLSKRAGQGLFGWLPSATHGKYQVYGQTERMYKKCAAPAEYTIDDALRGADAVPLLEDGEEVGVSAAKDSVWHGEIGLPPTFATWAHVTMLHMWLLIVRFRTTTDLSLPDSSPSDSSKDSPEIRRLFQDTLSDHFFHDAEAKMEGPHALALRAIRQRYLKDLFSQWRGVLLAYDEGLVRGDAVLAGAIWRNLFKARGDVDVRKLAAVTAWTRKCLVSLEIKHDKAVLWGENEDVFGRQMWKGLMEDVDRPVKDLDGVRMV